MVVNVSPISYGHVLLVPSPQRCLPQVRKRWPLWSSVFSLLLSLLHKVISLSGNEYMYLRIIDVNIWLSNSHGSKCHGQLFPVTNKLPLMSPCIPAPAPSVWTLHDLLRLAGAGGGGGGLVQKMRGMRDIPCTCSLFTRSSFAANKHIFLLISCK